MGSVGRVPQYAAIFGRVSARRGKQVAIVAVAERMLEDAWTMLKTDKGVRLAPAAAAAAATGSSSVINRWQHGRYPSDAG